MRSRIIFSILLIIVLTSNLLAQRNTGVVGIQYSIAFPLQDTKNYIGKMSWKGLMLNYDKFLTQNLTVGFNIGWNGFDEKFDAQTIELQGTTVTGIQLRYLSTFPVLANFGYYFGDRRSNIRPYLGVGVGTYYVIERLQVGLFLIEKDDWRFGLAPIIGVLIPIDYVMINASLRYNHIFEGNNSITKEPFSVDYLSFNLGVAFPAW